MKDLQWYLEEFLEYPFDPETDRADRVLAALRSWGEETFRALFSDRLAAEVLEQSVSRGYSELDLRIVSDHPGVLAWPWEALRNPDVGALGLICTVERSLGGIGDPQPLPSSLPKDRVNVLLVVARAYGPQDVPFRSIAKPFVDLIEKENLPVHVQLLRPPSFEKLREHLRERRGFYHIVHFDGHGAFSTASGGRGKSGGQLVFETGEGDPDIVTAEKLSTLLIECGVPVVVLNACQSAMLDPDSEDEFASVATALLRAGMRSVVAMTHSLYVNGAQKFLPAFYRCLFKEGNVTRAVRAGRQKMSEDDKRVCIRGYYPLQDWLLPVLYQQVPLDLPFSAENKNEVSEHASTAPMELAREQELNEFVGRDAAILDLERAFRRKPAGILIQGLGGVGKTSLTYAFAKWLDSTGGAASKWFWFSFREIRNARYMFNRLGEGVLGRAFARTPPENVIDVLTPTLRKDRYIIVWDNFETVAGIPESSTIARVSKADRDLLAQFLERLSGGATKVLITSRSPEEWLGASRRFLLRLTGLDTQERWEFCELLVRDLGLKVDRDDPAFIGLINELHGHPLAMRVALLQLEKFGATELRTALHANTLKLNATGDEGTVLFATIEFAKRFVPPELTPLLTLLAMHRGFFSLTHLKLMAEASGRRASEAETLIQILSSAGLVTLAGGDIHEMHPMLAGYLSSALLPAVSGDDQEPFIQAFIDVTSIMADSISALGYTEKRQAYYYLGESLHSALSQAKRRELVLKVGALTQCIAALAQNNRDFDSAMTSYEELAEHANRIRFPEAEASAIHQIGRVAQAQGDFVTADAKYRTALSLYEQVGNFKEVAYNYNCLGILNIEQEKFNVARELYEKALAVLERFPHDGLKAMALHGMGIVALKRRELKQAEQYFKTALRLEKEADSISAIYHQLGRVEQERGEYPKAESWFRQSLQIGDRQDIELANTYHQLAVLASQRNDVAAARQWCTNCLVIAEKWNDQQLALDSYNLMGVITMQEKDFVAAEQWFRKALPIAETKNRGRALAICYRHLGILTGMKQSFIQSGEWLIKAALVWQGMGDVDLLKIDCRNFAVTCEHAPLEQQVILEKMWQEARLGAMPNRELLESARL